LVSALREKKSQNSREGETRGAYREEKLPRLRNLLKGRRDLVLRSFGDVVALLDRFLDSVGGSGEGFGEVGDDEALCTDDVSYSFEEKATVKERIAKRRRRKKRGKRRTCIVMRIEITSKMLRRSTGSSLL
jgi:hypothetical protein